MTQKARRNQRNATSQLVERKKMYKAKKQWMVAGMSFLVAMGLGAVASSTGVHADSLNAHAQGNQAQANTRMKAQQPADVQGQAKGVFNQIQKHTVQQNALQSSASTKVGVSAKASSVAPSSAFQASSKATNIASSSAVMPSSSADHASASSFVNGAGSVRAQVTHFKSQVQKVSLEPVRQARRPMMKVGLENPAPAQQGQGQQQKTTSQVAQDMAKARDKKNQDNNTATDTTKKGMNDNINTIKGYNTKIDNDIASASNSYNMNNNYQKASANNARAQGYAESANNDSNSSTITQQAKNDASYFAKISSDSASASADASNTNDLITDANNAEGATDTSQISKDVDSASGFNSDVTKFSNEIAQLSNEITDTEPQAKQIEKTSDAVRAGSDASTQANDTKSTLDSSIDSQANKIFGNQKANEQKANASDYVNNSAVQSNYAKDSTADEEINEADSEAQSDAKLASQDASDARKASEANKPDEARRDAGLATQENDTVQALKNEASDYLKGMAETKPGNKVVHYASDLIELVDDTDKNGNIPVGIVNATNMSGVEGTNQAVSPSVVPSAYKLANDGSQNVTFDGKVHQVNVVEKNKSNSADDTISFFASDGNGHEDFVGRYGFKNAKVHDVVNTKLSDLQNELNEAIANEQNPDINPSNYQLLSDEPFTLNDTDHPVYIKDVAPNQQTDDVPVNGNVVHFKGNLVLHFHTGKTAYGDVIVKNITLPYDITTSVDQNISDLLENGKQSDGQVYKAQIPDSYLGTIINQFNTKNFTYDKNVNSKTYDGIYVAPNDAIKGKAHVTANADGTYTYSNPDITFNYTSNKSTENVHYQYSDGNNHKFNEGNHQYNGQNDMPGSDSDNQGLKPGWHQSTNPNNTWTYGNGGSDASGNYNDSDTINVLPNKADAKVHFIISDANAKNNGKDVKDHTFSGNDYRASDAGDNGVDIRSNNTKPMPKGYVSDTSDAIPAGYQLVNSDNKVPFDNGAHDVKIQGILHNGNRKNLSPSDNKPTDPSDMSDTVAVTIKELDGKRLVRQYKQYVAESGRTGDNYTVSGNQFQPKDKGYVESPANQSVTGEFTPNGISVKDATFTYQATSGDSINVEYVNQNGKNVTPNADASGYFIINGHNADTGNVYTDDGMPAGYHFVSASDENTATNKSTNISGANASDVPYTINSTNGQNITIHVAGNVPDIDPVVPQKPNKPSDNPQKPSYPSDVPDNQNNQPSTSSDTPNSPYNPSNARNQEFTFYVTIKDFNGKNNKNLVRTYMKRMTIQQPTGDTQEINPSTFDTENYTPTNSDKSVYPKVEANGLSFNHITWNYDANKQSTQVHYIPTSGNIPSSDASGGNGYIKGHTDSDVEPNQTPTQSDNDSGSQLPAGYTPSASDLVNPNKPYDNNKKSKNNQPNPNYNPIKPYHFNINGKNSSDNIKVVANKISGTATIHLVYQEIGKNGRPFQSSDDKALSHDIQVPINGKVGDPDIVINPSKYDKFGYSDSNSKWTIPMNWKVAKNGNNTNYNLSNTFTYNAETAGELIVNYADIDKGAQVVNPAWGNNGVVSFHDYKSNKDYTNAPVVGNQTFTGSDMENKQYMKSNFNLNKIIDWIVGQNIQLGQNGANNQSASDYDILNVPAGYHLTHKLNPITIQLTKGKMLPNGKYAMVLTLGMTKPVTPTPKPQPKPASSASSAVAPSSASASGSSVAPASSGSASAPSTRVIYVPKYINHTNTVVKKEVVPKYIYVKESGSQATNPTPATRVISDTTKSGSANHTEHIKMHTLRAVSNVNAIKVGHTNLYHGARVTRVRLGSLHWIRIMRQCLAHSNILSISHIKDYYKVLRPHHQEFYRVNRIFVVRKGGKKFTRFEIRLNFHHHKVAFVTGARKYTRNSYIQFKQFRHAIKKHLFGRRYAKIRVDHTCFIHSGKQFTKANRVRKLHKGKTLKVARMIYLSGKYQQTRFVLTNGKTVTANLNWVHLIK